MTSEAAPCPLCDGSGGWREHEPVNPQMPAIGRGIDYRVWHEANRICSMFHDGRYTYDALHHQFACAQAEATRLKHAHPEDAWRQEVEKVVVGRCIAHSHLQPLLEEVGFEERP